MIRTHRPLPNLCAALSLIGLAFLAPGRPAWAVDASQPPGKCALILTDDDIPSGSATAGALYVADAELGKDLLTRDVVAVAQGFRDGGCACVVVLDSHDGAIDPAPLQALGVPVMTPANDPQWTWPFLGSSIASASVAALVGYHSRAGQTDGFRPHTINDRIQELRLNGSPAGEVAHAILGLGAFGVPVVLISGDMNAAAEGAALIPAVEQVAVRFRDSRGAVGFLGSEEAAGRLRQAARRGAGANIAPYRPKLPVEIRLRTFSPQRMADRSRTLGQAFEGRAEAAGWDGSLLGDFRFEPTLRVESNEAIWQAPNALAAYVSVAVAASHLRGPDNFEQVSRGFDAYRNGRLDEAIAAYGEALLIDPQDVATFCRMGAAYQRLGKVADARKWFRAGVDRESEIDDEVMRSWCALGLAQTELAMGNAPAARAAALRVIALPDQFGRHAKAREILEATD